MFFGYPFHGGETCHHTGKMAKCTVKKLIMENNNNFRISLVFYKILSFLSFVVGGILGYITYSFNIYGLIIVLIYIAIFKHLLNYLFVERAAAGLYSTAGDLARLLNEAYFLYSREDYQGKVISNNSLRIMAKTTN